METLAAVVREQPKAPSTVVPNVPRDLEKLILRRLQKDPGRRFEHMADVGVELQEIKAGPRESPLVARGGARDRGSFDCSGLAPVASTRG